MFSTSQPGSLFVHYPPLNTQLALIQHAVHTFVSLRHHIQGRAHHCTRYLPRSHPQQSNNIKVINRARRCYPTTIQCPEGTTPEGPCTRAGVVDVMDAVAGSRTQLPRELCWRCTTAAVASEHNSRGDHAQHCKRRGHMQ